MQDVSEAPRATIADRKRKAGQCTAKDLAIACGVSVRAINLAVAEGRITRGPDNWFPNYDRAKAEFLSSRTREPSHSLGAGGETTPDDTAPDGGESPTMSRARKLRADADLAETKAGEAKGSVVLLADVQSAWFAIGRTIRSRFDALPDAAAQAMEGMDAQQRRTYLSAAINGVFADFPKTPPLEP